MDNYRRPENSYSRDSFGRSRRREDEEDYRRVRHRPDSRSERDPLKEEHLMELRDYAQWMKERHPGRALETEELDKRYDQYKAAFLKASNDKFFAAHCEAEWFRERYHPEESIPFRNQLFTRKKECNSQFLEDLSNGRFDSVLFDENNESKDAKAGEDGDVEFRYANLDLSKKFPVIFVKGLTDAVSRSEIQNFCSTIPNFKYFEMTDPRADKRMSRFAWIVLEMGTNASSLLAQIDHSKVGTATINVEIPWENKTYSRIQNGWSNKPSRLMRDLGQARLLTEHLDAEAGIEAANGSLNIKKYVESLTIPESLVPENDANVNVAEIKKELDMLILYLHNVHFFDYYTGTLSTSPEDHHRRGSFPVRKPYIVDGVEAKTQSSWESRIDGRVELMTIQEPQEEHIALYGLRTCEFSTEKQLSLYVRQEADAKFRCTECQKLFRGDSFVRKHIKSKHSNLIDHIPKEVEFFNRFAQDVGKVEPKAPPGYFNQNRNQQSRENWNQPPTRRPPMRERGGDRKSDPRALRSYHDLDAPTGGDIVLSYD